MNLAEFVNFFKEQVADIDTEAANEPPNKRRDGTPYHPGLFAWNEEQIVKKLSEKMNTRKDLFKDVDVETRYQSSKETCDLVFSSKDYKANTKEWAIEFKKISFIGDNGKNNDYFLTKVLSPYPKDRSLFHDIYKISTDNQIAEKKGIILMGWHHSIELLERSKEKFSNNPESLKVTKNKKKKKTIRQDDETELVESKAVEDRLENLEEVLTKNGNEPLSINPLVSMLEQVLPSLSEFFPKCNNITLNKTGDILFIDNITTHPCGYRFQLVGWQLISTTSLKEV